jgi:hypothetical protein
LVVAGAAVAAGAVVAAEDAGSPLMGGEPTAVFRLGSGKEQRLSVWTSLKEVSKMPFGDGTGPAGMGPMTGRAAGYCAGYPVPGAMNPVGGRGFWGRGGGWGRGRGWRNWYYATGLPGWARAGYLPAWGATPYTPYGAYGAPVAYGAPYAPQVTREQELDFLKGQAEYLEDALEGVRKQMQEVETEAKKEKK